MRILYDGRVFQMQKAGGVSRVFAEVISGLPADYYPLVTGVENFGKHVPGHPNLQQPGFKHFRPRHVTPVFNPQSAFRTAIVECCDKTDDLWIGLSR